MEKRKCNELGCKKIIEGYNRHHADFLLDQHKLKHVNEKRKKKDKRRQK